MKKILIGSRALAYWSDKSILVKPNTDWDIISDEFIAGSNVERHDPLVLNNLDVEQFASKDSFEFNGQLIYICNMKGLALIKRSHLWRDLRFDHHITMYHKFGLAGELLNLTKGEEEFLQTRTRLTKEKYPQGNPNLMQSKEDFFDDAVKKQYDHDYLHELFAFYDKPLYTRLLRSESLAWCEEEKWNQLQHEDKIKCAAEETFVIAAERMLIPANWKYSSNLAYFKALQKVCTTLCSGWFRDFAIDNYPEIVQQYNPEKFEKVKQTLILT